MERLRRAQAVLLEAKPRKLATLDKFCREFVELKQSGADPERQKHLQAKIEGQDSAIGIDDRGPGVLAAVVYFYYRVSLDSVGVSSALRGSPSPQGVRQILYRLHRVWKELQSGGPPVRPAPLPNPPKPARVVLTPEERKEHKRISKDAYRARNKSEKPPRVALTPEERRELRLAYARAYNAKKKAKRSQVVTSESRMAPFQQQTKKFGEVTVLEILRSSSGGLVNIETAHGPMWVRAKAVFRNNLFI